MTYQTSLHNFLNNSEKYQNQDFLHQPIGGVWHTFSFTEVEQQARKIAAGLINNGFERGDRIGILSQDRKSVV